MKTVSPPTLTELHQRAAAYTADVEAAARLDRIEEEFRAAFEFLHQLPPCVTFFGSAQVRPDNVYYRQSYQLASRLVTEQNLAIVTGGGPGIMAAANQAAAENGGVSAGLTIDITTGEAHNPYMNRTLSFHYFFARKVALGFVASMYIFFPGGYGTLDEFLELIMLVQTKKIEPIPIICFGTSFWHPLERFFDSYLLRDGYIAQEDLKIFTITDSINDVMNIARALPPRT